MKSLIIGLGFGQLYKRVLEKMGHQVITVDINSKHNPMFLELTTALATHPEYDTVHICTPNNTHYTIAQKVAPHSKMVFIEKPGVQNAQQWQILVSSNKNTKFIMTKNNMWRTKIWLDGIKTKVSDNDIIDINWRNINFIPNPGGWFTNKALAYGGVSRDLLPHLLSIFIAINPNTYKDFKLTKFHKEQKNTLKELIEETYETTGDNRAGNYGTMNPNGVYDVDDLVELEFNNNEKTYRLTADWKAGKGFSASGRKDDEQEDDIAVHFNKTGETKQEDEQHPVQIGICPESAYERMIADWINHKDDNAFWQKQLEYDLWIHEIITNDDETIIH